jgi:hypothetical protein
MRDQGARLWPLAHQFGLSPDIPCFIASSLVFMEISQPFGDVPGIPDSNDGESLSQNLFGSAQIGELRAGESVTIRPRDPAPSPLRVSVQPLAIEIVSLAGFA